MRVDACVDVCVCVCVQMHVFVYVCVGVSVDSNLQVLRAVALDRVV